VAAVVVALTRTAPDVEDVLLIPEITIAGSVPRRVNPLARAPHAYRDITEMHCDEWRELSMGSGRVQICD
jgi:hypothetical protein